MESIWATLLAKALEGKNVKELLSNVGAGGGAPATATGSAVPSAAGGPVVEEKKEAEEEKEESDDDMVRSSLGFDLNTHRCFLGLWSFRLTLDLFYVCLFYPYQNRHIFLIDIVIWR